MLKNTRKLAASLALCGLVLAPVACGDSTLVPPEEETLTAQEATTLATGLQTIIPSDVSLIEALTVLQQVPCPAGGAATVEGSLTPGGDGLSGSWSFTMVPVACVVSQDGLVFTVNGNPSLTFAGNFSVGETGITITNLLSGDFSWEVGTRTGDCSASLNITVTVDTDLVVSGSATGTLCGHQISLDSTL
ncbi:MAG: hypothetical protein J4G12_04500 [Gemmatimonadetes bacterium]|nr:hypothetical protein [Gemmatimonadota bacterium]